MDKINRFGTTKDMIIHKIQEGDETSLVAIDSNGLYITTPDKVDNNLADLNRYAKDRSAFLERLEQLGLSPLELFESNKDKIQVVYQTTKKINPLKASKRGLSK